MVRQLAMGAPIRTEGAMEIPMALIRAVAAKHNVLTDSGGRED